MIRSRLVPPRFVQLAAVVAVILIFGQVRAAEPDIESQRLARALDKIEQRLNLMDTRLDTALDLAKDLRQVREDVNRLQRDVNELKQRPNPGTTTQSYYPGTQPVTPGVPSTSLSVAVPVPVQVLAQGRVRLVNTYLTDMTATVNGFAYTVRPAQTVDVPVPVGTVSYQVPQAGIGRTTTINPGDTITLTLFPMM